LKNAEGNQIYQKLFLKEINHCVIDMINVTSTVIRKLRVK
jgi:hypothetical protein